MSARLIVSEVAHQHTGFTQVPNHILRARNLSRDAKLLYSILRSYCWQKSTCFPSYETLMADMQCCNQTLASAIKELIECGLITVQRRGQGKTNRYILTDGAGTSEQGSTVVPEAAHACSLKHREQELYPAETEEYSSNKYEDGNPSNIRIAEKEETDYVKFHNAEQGSEEGLKPEGSKEGAVLPPNGANHRNLEKIERRKIAPPVKPKSLQSMHAPHAARTTSVETTIQTAIQGYIRDAAVKLHDEAPLKSSTTRAYNLYLRSGIQLNTFFDTLYDAEQETMRRSATITKETSHGFKNRMAYFFAVLEDKLGLRGQESNSLVSGTG
jgi:hypothetical protein